MNHNEMKSILLFKLRYIGDVLLTTPAISLLRQAYPKAHITMVVTAGTEDVIRHNPHLNQIITIDRKIIDNSPFYNRIPYEWSILKKLRERRYDISVDFDSGERAAILAFLTMPDIRAGFRYKKGLRRILFNRQVSIDGFMHTVERNLMLVEKSLHLVRKDTRLELYTSQPEEQHIATWLHKNRLHNKQFFMIHSSARFWYKRWPAEKWAAIIDIIQRELGIPVILVGSQKERDEVRIMMSRMKTDPYSLIGQTSILELAALAKKATLFIGNDSGPMHIAAAAGTPVIALFGPSSPDVWRPWGNGHVVISKEAACSPCKHPHCGTVQDNCMNKISVEDVLQTICQFLEKTMVPLSGHLKPY